MWWCASLDGWHSQNILGILAIYSAWICKAMIMFSVACLIEFHCPLTFVGGNILWLFYWRELLLRWPLFKVSGPGVLVNLGPSQQNRRWFRSLCLGSTHPAKWRFSSGSPTKHVHNPGGDWNCQIITYPLKIFTQMIPLQESETEVLQGLHEILSHLPSESTRVVLLESQVPGFGVGRLCLAPKTVAICHLWNQHGT